MAKNVSIEELEVLETGMDTTPDAMEAELNEATAPVKEKKEKKAKEPKVGPDQIGATEMAEVLGISSRDLRIFLRKKFRDMGTEKGKTYTWARGSQEAQDVVDAYKAYKAEPRKKAEKIEKGEDEATPVMDQVSLDDLDLDAID